MKAILSLLVLIVSLSFVGCGSCSPFGGGGTTEYKVPAGYQTCRTNMDCPKGTYCGFVGVDTYAVCKQ